MRTRSETILYIEIMLAVTLLLINLVFFAIHFDNTEKAHPDLSIDTTHYWYRDDLHLISNPDSLAMMVSIRAFRNYTKHKQINPKQLDSLQRLRLMLITEQ